MKKKFLFFLWLLACSNSLISQVKVKSKNLSNSNSFVDLIQKAHRFDAFHKQKAVVFDVESVSEGKATPLATITSLTGSGKIKFESSKGKTIVFDGKKTWITPANTDYPRARFDIFTYHYFFMAPFKLSDKGAKWELLSDKVYDFNDYARAKLTFQSETGDSPNDWYIAHRNKATNYLEALSYIVTYGGKPVAEAEKKASAIFYSDWKSVEGVMFATTWKFMNWSDDKGFFSPKGEIKIKNIRFFTPTEKTFLVPLDSKEIGL